MVADPREGAKISQDERECLQALRTSGYEKFKNRNSIRLEGTCEWFLQHGHFRKWQQSSSSSLLWVSADPGCGKSVLARSLIDQEMKAAEFRVTCYFFFKDDNEEQKSVTTALSALLHQLFSQKYSLIHHAMQDYTAEGDQLPQSFHKLWNILMKATSDPTAGEVICFLDALDECEESGRYDIINVLNAFYKHAASPEQNPSQLKFLVTSRPYLDIERRFAGLINLFPTIHLQGEEESGAISREINSVIKWRISELGPDLKLDRSEQLTLEKELLSMTHRTYLWLKLIFEVVYDEISPTNKRLKQIIGTLPSTVDEVYEAILSKIKDRERARKLLHIVVAATRPLTLEEMNIALAIEDHHRSYEDLDLENGTRFEATVKHICGLFVSVIDHKVYLIHQTAKEFLVGKSQALTGQWKHSLHPGDSELLMARICITYLMFKDFQDGLSDDNHSDDRFVRETALSESVTQQKREEAYFGYAACFWTAHYGQAQKQAIHRLVQSVLTICDTQSPLFRKWFYVYWSTVFPYISTPNFINSIMVGSYFGHEAVVKWLLEAGNAEVDSEESEYGRTPLLWAARNGHKAVVKLLLETGRVMVDSKESEYGRTPLSWAAGNGHETVARLLLETGKAKVDSEDNDGRGPLSWAAENGHEALIKLLLETGKAKVNTKDNDGRTPLSWATENGSEAVVKVLLKTGKAEINFKDKYGETPLSWAAENGHIAVVKLLLETGKAEINSKDKYGQIPLSWAAKNGHMAVVKLLLETGQVEADSKDTYGRTPLSLAAMNGHMAVVKLLLETGKAEINSKDKYGQIPLSWASMNDHPAVVKMLLQTGQAEVNLKESEYGRTPLSWAALNGHETVVKLLLETGKAEVDPKDHNSRTPLSLAARKGHMAVVRLLFETDQAEADTKDTYGRTPLLWAAGDGHIAVVKLLLETRMTEADFKDSSGRTPLSLAAMNGYMVVVKLLIKTGKVDVDSKDKNGRTPLSWAAGRGHEAVVTLLLETGKADVDSKDKNGRTPLSWAARPGPGPGLGHKTVVKLLRSHCGLSQ
jgi:ankyrin repeat protein